MEGKSPRGGSGSKTNSTEGDVVANEEMAPNVNGSNKDGGTSTGTDYDSIEADIREMNRELSPGPRTRKRKAAEMKTDDESEEAAIKKEPESKDDEGSINTDASTDKIEDESSSPLNDIASDLREISVPEKQVFGKGKRARVPNKRYSDLSLNKVTFDSPKGKAENGQVAEVKIEKEDVPELIDIKKTVRRSKSTSVDNLNYLKPFSYGWKRELVYRSTNDSSMRRMGDIYYYTPTGKKVRSMREVAETLPKHKDLTIGDFTFTKEPLGIDDPEKEIIRDAKIKTGAAKKHVKVVSKPAATSTPTTKAKPVVATSSAKSVKSKTSFKVKMPKAIVKTKEKKVKVEPKSEAAPNDDMEVGTYPSNWTPKKQKVSNRRSDATTTRSATKLRQPPALPETESKVAESAKFMDTYLQNLAYGYKTLLYVFQYLKVQDLLRAGCVCTMWRDVARHPLLWKTVRMKNSQIHSFDGFANALKEHNTAHLDLRKMLLPPGAGDEMWPEFTNALRKVDTLRKIELCRCSAEAIETLAVTNPNLEVINAVTIKCESMSFSAFNNLKNLTDLRLKSTAGLAITGGVTALGELTRLKYLSLTSIKELNKANIEVLENLVNLEVLEIGECSDFPSTFGTQVLTKLTKLEKLRLEKGQGECHTFEMLNALKSLNSLSQLELVNFDIKAGFDKALGGCVNLKKLLIIPTYISQSATTNRMVLGGVLLLQKTLQHFVWGVTLELLRVTELFVDQCEQPDKESKDKTLNTGDSIPVLKPVPFHGISQPEIPPSSDSPQVEILPLPNLQKLLLQNLPTTRVRILKIPFHATWRQSITDSVNY